VKSRKQQVPFDTRREHT